MSWIVPVGPDEVSGLLPRILERPAAEGVRIIALHWLHELSSRRERWRELAATTAPSDNEPGGAAPSLFPPNPEDLTNTLHKARVALRRLRAVEKEHAEDLDGVFSRRISRSLRALGRATNDIRDRDVQVEWLDAEMDSFDDVTRGEAAQLRASLSRNARPFISRVEKAFAKHFDPIAARLSRRLSWYLRRQRVGDGFLPVPLYAAAVASRLEAGAIRIQRDVEQIAHAQDTVTDGDRAVQERLHDIRLHLKRHRAMLAPMAQGEASLATLYDAQSRGQDLLGAMRDADVLAQRAHDDGYASLTAVLAGTRLANLEAFLDQWVAGQDNVQRLFDAAIDRLRTVAYAVRDLSVSDSASDESPRITREATFDANDGSGSSATAAESVAHGLPMEIERKFLLKDVPPDAVAMPPIVIEQGWIPGTMLRERLRRSTYPDGRVRCTRTVKLGRPEARIEIEEDTGNAVFQAMWALTASARIRKLRHVIRDGAHAWEIDVFSDRALVLAEVELNREDEEVTIPAWLAPFVVREVTGETAYLNSQMARPDLVADDLSTTSPR